LKFSWQKSAREVFSVEKGRYRVGVSKKGRKTIIERVALYLGNVGVCLGDGFGGDEAGG
jgi:hypothetical protein